MVQCDATPTDTEARCSSGQCPASIEQREQYRYCSGSSAECTGDNLKWSAWQTAQDCSMSQICGGAGTAPHCAPCDDPPASQCDGDYLLTYPSPGKCEEGECAYQADPNPELCDFGCEDGACNPDPCLGVTCETPPAPSCDPDNPSILREYLATGSCVDGRCEYDYTEDQLPQRVFRWVMQRRAQTGSADRRTAARS
jgi:hypothetical protein